jgi:tRNA pseudouridine32 synthase/23S rRNA pseudouridine746 synthase
MPSNGSPDARSAGTAAHRPTGAGCRPAPILFGVRKAPLPVRDGLNPSRIRLPDEGPPTVLAYLVDRFAWDADRVREKVAAGEVVDGDGAVVTTTTAFAPQQWVFMYRDPAPEPRVPFEIDILHRDDDLLVVDKQHFLATMPRGLHVVESALVRLRRELDLPDLSPIHRLDRVTAGVLVFSVRPANRGAYQTMFAQRRITKYYEAVAPYRPEVPMPARVASRIVKYRGTPTAQQVPGEPNAHTRIELLAVDGGRGLYGLHPATGKVHQLRLHMNSLGLPIVGDNFYPTLLDTDRQDYSDPLQLLARRIEFDDPFTGEHRRFESRRRLASWTAATGR